MKVVCQCMKRGKGKKGYRESKRGRQKKDEEERRGENVIRITKNSLSVFCILSTVGTQFQI